MAWARARSTSFTIGKVAQMRLLIVPIGRRPGRKRWNKAWCDSLNARCVVSYSARCDQSTFALWAWTWLAYLGHRCRKNLDWKRRLRNADERRSTQIRSASCQLISATSGYTRVCADQLGAGFHWASGLRLHAVFELRCPEYPMSPASFPESARPASCYSSCGVPRRSSIP